MIRHHLNKPWDELKVVLILEGYSGSGTCIYAEDEKRTADIAAILIKIAERNMREDLGNSVDIVPPWLPR